MTDVQAATTSEANPSMTEANYRELLDKFADQKKQKRTVESEKLKEINQLQQRYDQLQTDFENAKVSTAGANKKVKQAQDEFTDVENEIEAKTKQLEEKNAAFDQSVVDLRNREGTIEELKQDYVRMEEEL